MVQVAVQMSMLCGSALTLLPHSSPLNSTSGKSFDSGFQKQDVGPALNRGQLLSIKLPLSLFSSCCRRPSQANCLFLLFHFRYRMDISPSDGSILSKGLETALRRPFEKLQTFVIVQSELDLDVCVGVRKKRKETGVIVVLRFPRSRIIKSILFHRARFFGIGNGCLLSDTCIVP